jgi:ankyrin repeat protein
MNDNAAQQMIDAIDKNDIAMASSLITSSVVNLNGEPWPLHRAAGHGRVEIMTMLLDAGANINTVDKDQHTSCHIAIVMNQFDAFKLLVERGANLGVVDSDDLPLLSFVAQYVKDERFMFLLLDAGAPLDGLSSFNLMKLAKGAALFNRLVARGVDFTGMRDEHGYSLCHHVARSIAREDDVRFLVNAGGHDAVHAVDKNGWTPLQLAALYENESESAVRVLVEFGAEIDRKNDITGWNALHYASRSHARSSRVELLLALGADVGLCINSGRTACHFAVMGRKPAVLCALVAAGGDLDQPDNTGETLRMFATRKNVQLPTTDEIDAARQRIAKTRLDLVRERAFQICVGLHLLDINALELCEILMYSFGALGSLILFHQWWAIATKVRHFHKHISSNEQ